MSLNIDKGNHVWMVLNSKTGMLDVRFVTGNLTKFGF
jgi:hypothetical protein